MSKAKCLKCKSSWIKIRLFRALNLEHLISAFLKMTGNPAVCVQNQPVNSYNSQISSFLWQSSPSNTWDCCHQGNVTQQWDEVKGHQWRSGNSGCLDAMLLFSYWTNYLDLQDTPKVIDSGACRISSNTSLFAILMRRWVCTHVSGRKRLVWCLLKQ